VSQGELEHRKYAAIVAAELAAAELDPGRLEIDIGECALLADTETIRSVLTALHGLGVRLALDDFGEDGASMLSSEDSRAFTVLNAIVALAESLSIGVTAEGVETIEELDLVRRLGCSDIQGFLFGRPISADDALQLAADSESMNAGKDVEPRPPRHTLIRCGSSLGGRHAPDPPAQHLGRGRDDRERQRQAAGI